MKLTQKLALTAGLVLLLATAISAFFYSGNLFSDQSANENTTAMNITVYRDPNCGCCTKWIKHLEENGFVVTDVQTGQLDLVKVKYKIPQNLASCHTAIIDDYVIEGHVPAGDIKQLIKNRPDVAGLSVPQMPVGTPGMEMGDRKDPFTVISFQENGNTEIFREYIIYSTESFR